MNDKQTTPSLDQALNSARTSVEEQRLNAGNVSTHQPRRKQIKNILAIVLCVVCAALLFHRLQNIPQINEWPDVSSNPIIVRASLASIVEDAENYRAKNGSYPKDLGVLNLSLGLFHLIDQSALVYEPGVDTFTIVWTFKNWRATYDSTTQEIDIAPTGAMGAQQ
jgi:hypothetical protein